MALSRYRQAVLAQVRAEIASREAADNVGTPFDPRSLCHIGQAEAVADDTRTQAWVTTRRAGKSRGFVYKALRVATAIQGVNVLYLSTSIKRGVSTIWDLLLQINREHSLGGIPNHTRHFLRLPNGSKVWVSGCETKTEADAWRGVLPRTALVFVDEGQDWKPELLAYTYGDVIIPSLSDIGGQFILAGTPGSPRGFFFNFHKAPGVAVHKWSLFQNPHVLDARRMLDEAMRVRGCDETDPSIRREFYAEFATDAARQIFPYLDALNGYDSSDLPKGKWQYVIGADFGTVDAAAVVVWGWVPASPHLWVIETDSRPALGSSAQVELVRSTAARYEPGLIASVGDPGGGGAGLIVDLRQEHLLGIEAAQKTGKAAACIVMRDGLRSGKIRIPRSEKAFISELQEPEWDPDRIGEVVKGHMPDRCDAALYGYRRSIGFHHWKEAEPEKTAEEQEIARMLAAQQREANLMREFGIPS